MCTVDVRSLIPATTAPHYAGCKRPHALMLDVYDPAAAEQRAASSLPMDGAGGQPVPFLTPPTQAAAEQPINAMPLAVAAPTRAMSFQLQPEPSWLRKYLLPHLGLRLDLPVHFVGEKVVTVTDLDPHQHRFRLPTDGVLRRLRPILSAAEREAANLTNFEVEEAPRPRPPKQQQQDQAAGEEQQQVQAAGEEPHKQVQGAGEEQQENAKRRKQGKKHGGLGDFEVEEAPRPRPPKQQQQDQVAGEEQQQVQAAGEEPQSRFKQQGNAKRRKQGKKHGGLGVYMINRHFGISELQLARWGSSRGIIIKGDGYMNFINQCGFEPGDVVSIWAFRERHFRFFGVTMCHESPLYLLITKEQHPR